ncbi:hypothetical protein NHF48_020430 [Sphingomonas sp. H160509]|nr:hypothetical protein [Sphingomonas sp. H160509]MDD1452764.1 hypothetical protein [Sphingomonas sp. H160509]
MTDHGVSRVDASYYEGRINEGGVFVSVDTSAAGINAEDAADVLYRSGGHTSTRTKVSMA